MTNKKKIQHGLIMQVADLATVHNASYIQWVDEKTAHMHFPEGHCVCVNGVPTESVGKVPDGIELTRQATAYNKQIRCIHINGAGGIGVWVALALAIARPDIELVVFDGDRVELHNTERIPFRADTDVGTNKTTALSQLLYLIKGSQYQIVNMCWYFSIDMFKIYDNELPDIVIDCTDNIEIQKATYKWCKDNSVQFYKVGTRDNNVMITDRVPEWDSGYEEPVQARCGQGIPQWVAPQMLGAGQIVSYILRQQEITFNNFIQESK